MGLLSRYTGTKAPPQSVPDHQTQSCCNPSLLNKIERRNHDILIFMPAIDPSAAGQRLHKLTVPLGIGPWPWLDRPRAAGQMRCQFVLQGSPLQCFLFARPRPLYRRLGMAASIEDSSHWAETCCAHIQTDQSPKTDARHSFEPVSSPHDRTSKTAGLF